ncbi:DNA polymerase III subunit delta [bacterium]|nr:DNA polymerase III subunit delta [candidate division CSSED10-310 bacterium]
MSKSNAPAGLDSILDDIGKNDIRPVYLVYGEESYLVFHARKAITEALCHVRRVPSADSMDPETVTPAHIITILRSPSLFNPFQIVVINDAPWFDTRRIGEAEPFREWLESSPTSAALVLTADTVDKRLGLIKTISKCGVVLGFEKAKSYDQGNVQRDTYYPMIRDRLAGYKQTIESEAWQLLRQWTPDTLWAVVNAIDVVSAYAGTRQRITVADVSACIHDHADMPGYVILEALGQRRADHLLTCIEKMLESGMHGLQLNKTVSRRIRTLLATHALALHHQRISANFSSFRSQQLPGIQSEIEKDPTGANLLGGMNPYALFMLLKQSTQFDTRELIGCLTRLESVDLALKSGATAAGELLQLALLPVCRKRRAS